MLSPPQVVIDYPLDEETYHQIMDLRILRLGILRQLQSNPLKALQHLSTMNITVDGDSPDLNQVREALEARITELESIQDGCISIHELDSYLEVVAQKPSELSESRPQTDS